MLSIFYRYKEIYDYSYATTQSINGKPIGHFTQCVWRATTTIGVGKAVVQKGGMTHTYIVARYTPKGNFIVSLLQEQFFLALVMFA